MARFFLQPVLTQSPSCSEKKKKRKGNVKHPFTSVTTPVAECRVSSAFVSFRTPLSLSCCRVHRNWEASSRESTLRERSFAVLKCLTRNLRAAFTLRKSRAMLVTRRNFELLSSVGNGKHGSDRMGCLYFAAVACGFSF